MTLNEINSKCPSCKCTTADVLAKVAIDNKTVVVIKCTEKGHQYFLDLKGKNTEWKQFFNQDLHKDKR